MPFWSEVVVTSRQGLTQHGGRAMPKHKETREQRERRELDNELNSDSLRKHSRPAIRRKSREATQLPKSPQGRTSATKNSKPTYPKARLMQVIARCRRQALRPGPPQARSRFPARSPGRIAACLHATGTKPRVAQSSFTDVYFLVSPATRCGAVGIDKPNECHPQSQDDQCSTNNHKITPRSATGDACHARSCARRSERTPCGF